MGDNIKKKRLKTGLDILLGTENKEFSDFINIYLIIWWFQ